MKEEALAVSLKWLGRKNFLILMAYDGQQQIDVTQLPLQQLAEIKQTMEQEIQVLTGSFGTLKTAIAKFNTSLNSVNSLTPENKGIYLTRIIFNIDKSILVPLTESLYVPATLSNVESVVIDVGTGYYSEKSVQDAGAYYKKRMEYLKKNIQGLQATMMDKQKQYTMVVEVMQMKIQQQKAESSK